MKIIAQLFCFAACLSSVTFAQVQKFPYEAKVVVDEAYVRSGNGEKFYPTDSLPRGTVVTVLRHDAGGWYKIEPPAGSFSWILQAAVRQTSADKGDVVSSDAIAMVGSKFGDEIHVWQRKMLAGEQVSILGERIVDTDQGPKAMFKIKPPEREFRWIPGSSVVPVGEQQKAAHDRNPYAVPSDIAERQRDQRNAAVAQQPSEPVSRYSPSHRLARLQRIRGEQRELHELDQKFRTMVLSPPSQWDLQSIESDYRDLQNKATHKPVAGQIDLRFPAIDRYRLRKAQLDELHDLTSATERRDAELLAAQFSSPTATQTFQAPGTMHNGMVADSMMNNGLVIDGMTGDGIPTDGSSFDAFEGTFSSSQSTASTEFTGGFGNAIPIPEANMPFAAGDISASTSAMSPVSNSALIIPGSNSQISPSSRYIGAGIVQRDSSSGEGYILATPTGKVLAHLQPDGNVDLEQHVGQSVGLQGKRYFDSEVKRDRIEVSGLESIRLKH